MITTNVKEPNGIKILSTYWVWVPKEWMSERDYESTYENVDPIIPKQLDIYDEIALHTEYS